MKGYKAFNNDWTCHGFQYEIGKEYSIDQEPIMCKRGFHFCANPIDVFGYYPDILTVVAEVEATGEIIQEGTKFCTNKIRIVKEITRKQIQVFCLDKCNTGHDNSGDYNSGDYNSGNFNSGDYNSGNFNSGRYNSGNFNSGNFNSGDSNSRHYNTGYYNSGDYNSGNFNSGHYNAGCYNSGNFNSGFFNSNEPTVRIFNHDSGMSFEEFKSKTPEWFWGHLSEKNLSVEDIEFLKSLPHFDSDIFFECTGVKI